jgi:hypothetical protein
MLRAAIPSTTVIATTTAATTFQYLPSATPSQRQNDSIRMSSPPSILARS